MKKHFTKIAIAITAILTIGTVTLVSCNKEENVVPRTTSSISMKSSENVGKIRTSLFNFYSACDEAYQKDAAAFIEACANNDSSVFWALIGITTEEVSELSKLCGEELKKFLDKNPEYKDDETPCSDCIKKALPNLGELIASTDGKTAALVPSIIAGDSYWHLMLCELKCSALPLCSQALCLSSCMGKYLMSYEGIKTNHTFITHIWDAKTEYTMHKVYGSDIYAIKEKKNNVVREYLNIYYDENEFEITIVDDKTMHISLNDTKSPFILKDIKQDGDSVSFDMSIDDIFLASCVVYMPNGENFWSIMKGNSKAILIGPIAKEIGKMIIRGGIQFGIEKALESLFGGGSSAASECYAHMESLSRICVEGSGLPQVQHKDKHKNCYFNCKKNK